MASPDGRAVTQPPSPRFRRQKWSHAHAYRWVSNRPRSVAFELESIERVPVWTTTVRPMLVVRCLSRKSRAVRLTRDRRLHRVRTTRTTRWGWPSDDGPQSVERWPDSEEHDALFAPDSAALATRIASALIHLRFTYTPHNAQPVTVNFDLNGARRGCGERQEDLRNT